MKEDLKSIIKKYYAVELPISGGSGASFEDAIKIEINNSKGVSIEYAVLNYIHKLGNVEYKIVNQELIHNDGKHFDKIKLEVSNDPDNYHNYYFDVTSFFDKK